MPKAGGVWKNILFVKFGQIRSLITFGKILFFEKNNFFKTDNYAVFKCY